MKLSKPLSTDQKTFNKSARHLLRQNAKSLLASGSVCAYRGAAGRRCAAGPFITNREYKPSFEHQTVKTWGEANEVSRLFAAKGLSLDLVRRLQAVHDSYSVEDWPTQLAQVAADFNLKMVKV
jgi:hypothetical protein